MSENIDYSFITNENIKFLEYFYNRKFDYAEFVDGYIPNISLTNKQRLNLYYLLISKEYICIDLEEYQETGKYVCYYSSNFAIAIDSFKSIKSKEDKSFSLSKHSYIATIISIIFSILLSIASLVISILSYCNK